MGASDGVDPIISVDLGIDSGILNFRSLEEVEQWIRQEREFWSLLPSVVGFDGDLQNHLTTRLVKPLDKFAKLLTAVKAQANTASFAEHAKALSTTIRDHYQRPENSIFSKSAKGLFIKALMERAPVAASYAAGYFTAATMHPGQKISHEGIAKAVLFEAGAFEGDIKQRTAEAVAHLDAVRRQWNADREILVDQRNQEKQMHDLLVSTYEKSHKENNEALGDQLEENKRAHVEELTKVREELRALKATYSEFMKLEAPVTYWTNREAYHRKRARTLGWFACLWGVIILVAISLLSLWIWPTVSPVSGIDPKATLFTAGGPITILALALVLSFWSMRILIRMFLSHLHLEADAGEKGVLAETYLALTKESATLTAEDRAIILRALFRNAATGIVKDDAAPPTPIEFVTRDRGAHRGT